MDRLKTLNPFARSESHSSGSFTTYKVLTILSWLLAVGSSVYYTAYRPTDGHTITTTIWDINDLYVTGFTMNKVIGSIYWIVLFASQVGYLGRLFSNNADTVTAAANVGSHFILHNLFHFAFVMLFVRGHFGWAEVIVILNFFNLSTLYLWHHSYPRSIHWPVVSAPLAWYYVAIFWNGAIMVHHPNHAPRRILANIFIWSILVYGGFFLVVFKDYTMGFSLSVLMAAIGVGQFFTKVVALQWIFAFTVMGVMFVSTLGVWVPTVSGRFKRAPPPDQERAPLLAGENN